MEHGETGATHPDALPGRCDFGWGTGQHRDGVTVADAGRGQAARDPAGALVYLAPGMPDGAIRLAGDQALRTGLGGAVHRFGEFTQDHSFGSAALRAVGLRP